MTRNMVKNFSLRLRVTRARVAFFLLTAFVVLVILIQTPRLLLSHQCHRPWNYAEEQMNGNVEDREEDPERPKLDIFLNSTIPSTHQSWDHERQTKEKFSLPTRPSIQISLSYRQTKKEAVQKDTQRRKLDIVMHSTGPSTQTSLSHKQTETKAIQKATQRPKVDIMMHSTKPLTQISLSHKKTKTKAIQKTTQRPKVDNMMHSTKLFSQPFSNHKQQTKEKVTRENIQEPRLPKIELFIAILSAPHRHIRRIGLRQTWLSTVHNYPVVFKFFTDGQELSNETKHTLQLEQKKFGDLELLPIRGGYWFSHRLLHALFWANKRYSFKFFLRMDDDYFLCLDHLYNDLQYRKDEKFLYWGWLHCDQRKVRIDEGFVLFGVDLVREIIRRNNSLLCHPFGDQMVEILMTRLDREGVKATYFPDNARLMHRGLTLTRVTEDLCRNILAVHKAYPQQMKVLWSITKAKWFATSQNSFKKVHIKEYHEYCNATRGLDWKALLGTFYGHEPKPCWAPGVYWPMLHKYKVHGGRQRA